MLTYLFPPCFKYVESGIARSAPMSVWLSSEVFLPFLKAWGKDGGQEGAAASPSLLSGGVTGEPCLSSPSLWEGLLKLKGARRNPLWRMGGKHVVLLSPQYIIEKVAMPQLLLAAVQKWPPSLVIYASYQVFTLTVSHGDHCLCQLLAQLHPCVPGCSLPASQCLPETAGS